MPDISDSVVPAQRMGPPSQAGAVTPQTIDLPSIVDLAKAHGIAINKNLDDALTARSQQQAALKDYLNRPPMMQNPGMVQQLQLEAQQPMADFTERQKAVDTAIHQAQDEDKVRMTDFERQTKAPLYKFDSPETQARREAAIEVGMSPATAKGLNGASLDMFMEKTTPIASKAYQERWQAKLSATTAGKTAEETKQVAPSAQAEQELKRAMAAVERQKAGGEIYEGVSQGEIPLSDKEKEEMRTKLGSVDEMVGNLDRVEQLLGDHRVATDPEQRGRIKTRLQALTKGMLQSEQFKRLTAVDKDFFGADFFGDPNKLTGYIWPQAKAKLDEARRVLREEAGTSLKGRKTILTPEAKKKYQGSETAEHQAALKWLQDPKNANHPDRPRVLRGLKRSTGG